VGAPIQISDTFTTPSTSLGTSSDVWTVKPQNGGLYFQDEIRYKGMIEVLGARLNYWAPGKFADDAVENSAAPVLDATREQYKKQTFGFGGLRWKARLLPRLRVSFPVTSNNVLYFNYSHAMRIPHPRFLYAGLDPVYQDRSFLSNLGNPNLNPEVTVSYELGIKSQLTKDLALTATAFYNDKFDYIVSRKVTVKDQTGRFVEKPSLLIKIMHGCKA
jgi:outer membrane receptor protein involved in Fe transport